MNINPAEITVMVIPEKITGDIFHSHCLDRALGPRKQLMDVSIISVMVWKRIPFQLASDTKHEATVLFTYLLKGQTLFTEAPKIHCKKNENN